MTTGDADHRVFQRVVDHVERAIAGGEITPGDRLPSERELGERFAIARTSVREALRVLEHAGLIRSQPRDPRGPLVLAPSPGPARRSIATFTSTAGFGLAELVQFRMVADASANLLAARRRTPADLVALERNTARMRTAIGAGYVEFGLADLEFHEIIAGAAGNRLVQLYGDVTREAVLGMIQRTIIDADDRHTLMLRSVRHHRAVFDAIADRDGLLASRLARETLYAYYAEHVGDDDREIMADLVREVGGRLPEQP